MHYTAWGWRVRGHARAVARNDDPAHACRPWDKDRDGFVVGEGAGILVLEELELASSVARTFWRELVGYGMSGDAHHISAPSPGRRGRVSV